MNNSLALLSDGWLRPDEAKYPALTLLSGGWLYESRAAVQPQFQPYQRRIRVGGGLGGLVPLRRRLPAPFSRPPKDVVEFAVKASVQVASALGVDDVYEQMAIGVAEELLLMRLDR